MRDNRLDDHGAEAVTDRLVTSNGQMDHVCGHLKPGRAFETPGAPDDDGNSSQNYLY